MEEKEKIYCVIGKGKGKDNDSNNKYYYYYIIKQTSRTCHTIHLYSPQRSPRSSRRQPHFLRASLSPSISIFRQPHVVVPEQTKSIRPRSLAATFFFAIRPHIKAAYILCIIH